MLKFIEVTGKTKEEAISKGLAQLGLDQDDVSVEILDLGMVARPCRRRRPSSLDDGGISGLFSSGVLVRLLLRCTSLETLSVQALT